MPASYDLDGIRRGNSYSRTFTFRTSAAGNPPLDLTGSEIVFFADMADGDRLRLSTDDATGLAMTDPTSGSITLSLTPAQTRTFLAGRTKRYEIERRIGGAQDTLVAGRIIVLSGINDDDVP